MSNGEKNTGGGAMELWKKAVLVGMIVLTIVSALFYYMGADIVRTWLPGRYNESKGEVLF